jgi:hypothetical protein
MDFSSVLGVRATEVLRADGESETAQGNIQN